jgi:hypothetical protein
MGWLPQLSWGSLVASPVWIAQFVSPREPFAR